MSWVSPLSYCSHGVLGAGEKEHNVPETKTQSPKHRDTVLILRELSNRSLPFRTFCSLVLKWVGRLVSKPP